jgi:hypothetical protein
MAGIEGRWDATVQSPMGAQKSVMTLTSSGDGFSGTSTGPMGDAEISDGKVDGDTVTFTMKISKPFPMSMKGEAKLDGDSLTGQVDTGSFGKMAISATRQD